MPRRREPAPCGAAAVVGDLDLDGVALVADDDLRARAGGVLGRVGERLLDDPVRGEVDAAGERGRLALDPQLDRLAGVAGARGERVDVREARRRGRVGVRRADEPAELGQRLARDRPDQRGDLRGALGVAVDDAVGAAGLDRDHADVVRDRVVQLARDAHALGDHRGARLARADAARPAPPRRGPARVSCRCPRTTRPTVHGAATPPSSAATTPSG